MRPSKALVSFKGALVSLGGVTFWQIWNTLVIFKVNLKVLGKSGGAVRLGVFFMLNEFGIMAKFGLGVDLWWFGGFEQILGL